jgi:hypothetical protein
MSEVPKGLISLAGDLTEEDIAKGFAAALADKQGRDSTELQGDETQR